MERKEKKVSGGGGGNDKSCSPSRRGVRRFAAVGTDDPNDALFVPRYFYFLFIFLFQEAEEEMKELEEYKDAKGLLDSVELEH